MATIGVGVVLLVMNLGGTVLVDSWGRRRLLLIFIPLSIIALFVLGAALIGGHPTGVAKWAVVISLLAYMAFNGGSLSVVIWLLNSEVFPLSVRGICTGVAAVTLWISDLIVSFTTLSLIHGWGHQAVETLAQDRKDIVAISVGAQCHGFVALDENNEVIRPAKLWNDTETAPQLQKLREKIGEEAWVENVGFLPTAAYIIGKIAWLSEKEPKNFARLRRICLPHDWLTLRLCGRHVTDRSDASGTGYWSARENRYLLEYLALIDPNRDWAPMLSEVLGSEERAGTITRETAEALSLKPLFCDRGWGD